MISDKSLAPNQLSPHSIRQRPRRLRRSAVVRELVAETHVPASALVQPHFVLPQADGQEAIPSMPGIHRVGVDALLCQVESDLNLGVRSVLLFGLAEPQHKDSMGSPAGDADGAVQRAIRRLKGAFGDDLLVITDVCLCAYTDHGHCGVLDDRGRVDNDRSLEPLAAAALSHAQAGADLVAPSDMMDGCVGATRRALDASGHAEVGILAYAAKYASAYYGPFREAAGSAPSASSRGPSDRRGYQMDPRNGREALREVALDIDEGADMVMVKPVLAYLDVVRRVADHSSVPVAVYNVSGEYSSVKAAAERGWLDEASIVRENLVAMRRAGADVIITYHARDALSKGWLDGRS